MMATRDVIVIGGSTGASGSVRTVLANLPSDIDAAMLVVLHIDPTYGSVFAENLARNLRFKVQVVSTPMPLQHRTVYLPLADHHLVARADHVTVTHGPHENYWRPAIDVLFRSAAVAFGPRVIGILLSGDLDDGTAGLNAVKRCGGVTVIEDPAASSNSFMLETAASYATIDHVVAVDTMHTLLLALTRETAPAAPPVPAALLEEVAYADPQEEPPMSPGPDTDLTPFSCPECSGPLWQTSKNPAAFRCLVGHAFGANSLLRGVANEMERTLWAALRLFEQRTHLEDRMARDEARQGRALRAQIYTERSQTSAEHAANLRKLLEATRNDY